MNLLVSNTYLSTPYQTIRGECNFTAYNLFVLITRLQAKIVENDITFQWESVAERESNNFMSPEEIGEPYDAKEVVITDEENGSLYAIEESSPIEKIYLVVTDFKGSPKSQSPDKIKEWQNILNKALTDNPDHSVLISKAPDGVSKNWWQQQLSYFQIPLTYAPLYVDNNWWIDLSNIPDYTDVYERIIMDINQKLLKKWELEYLNG
jgi:hypothetical protein